MLLSGRFLRLRCAIVASKMRFYSGDSCNILCFTKVFRPAIRCYMICQQRADSCVYVYIQLIKKQKEQIFHDHRSEVKNDTKCNKKTRLSHFENWPQKTAVVVTV